MALEKKYSGIGGQAVMEGIMMKNQNLYAVAVRKSDGEIEIMTDEYKPVLGGAAWTKLPFIRGVFAFVDSLRLGLTTLSWSASFFDDEEETDAKAGSEKADVKLDSEKADVTSEEQKPGSNGEKPVSGGISNAMMAATVALSLVMAVGIFMMLPYFLSEIVRRFTDNNIIIAVFEGVIRLVIFIGYVATISLMKDIRRVYMYHGAEHKCINCIERGHELNVRNVMRASRLHSRCGTSFMLFIMFISIILFLFIRTPNPVLRIVIRLLLIPVISGISYEIIRLAGRTDNVIVNILSAPGLALQKITTKEPDEEMVEVAIKAVEAVFDWKTYLKESYGIDVDDKLED